MFTIEVKKPGELTFTDRKQAFKWDSLAIDQNLTKAVDTCSFTIEQYPGVPVEYIPEERDEIIITSDGVKVFAGYIVKVEESLNEGLSLFYQCSAKDYTDLLDGKLVDETYTDMTEAEIIEHIVTNYGGPGITIDNVDGTNLVGKIVFQDEEPSECIQKLAETFNKDWYIDYDKDIHYFVKEANSAPFSLTDTNGKYIPSTLRIARDSTQIKNSIKVEAGDELSSTIAFDTYKGNGVQHTFKASNRYSDVYGKINGSPVLVGIDGIHDFASYPILYNFQTYTFRVDPNSPLPDGDTIELGGYYYFPITVLVRENESIALHRERQYKIQDKNIKDRNTAKERAKAEIYAYAQRVQEGDFITNTPGLRSGQRITIQSDIRGWSEEFMINRVRMYMTGPSSFEWAVGLVSVKTFDILDLLARLVKKEINDDADRVTQAIDLVFRTIKVVRTIHQQNIAIIGVAGPYYPINFSGDPYREMVADTGMTAG